MNHVDDTHDRHLSMQQLLLDQQFLLANSRAVLHPLR